MLGEIFIQITCFAVIVASIILLFLIIFLCGWTAISTKYQEIRAKRVVVIEAANGQIGWMNPVIGVNEIGQMRLNSVRLVLNNATYQNLQEVLLIDQFCRIYDAGFV
jgi:hypothetical protein